MEKYLILLQKSARWLKSIYDLVAEEDPDYANDIQIAYNFVGRAIKTQEPNDVYRALQKFHAVLISDSEDESEEAYADFAEEIRQAIEDLGESGYIKESMLRALTKAVLKEIYQKPIEPQGLLGALVSLGQELQSKRPEFNKISKGHKLAHDLLKLIRQDIIEMVRATIRRNKEDFEAMMDEFNHHRESLMNFLIMWARQIHTENPEVIEEMNRVMEEVGRHLSEIAGQFQYIFLSVAQDNEQGGKNYINAYKQLKHLNEILVAMGESIDNLFEIGLKSGFGKKKK